MTRVQEPEVCRVVEDPAGQREPVFSSLQRLREQPGYRGADGGHQLQVLTQLLNPIRVHICGFMGAN